MSVLRNENRWDASNASYEGGLVTAYDKRAPTPEMHWIDYGVGGLTMDSLSLVGDGETDLSSLYHRLAELGETGRLRGHGALLRDRHAGGTERSRRPPARHASAPPGATQAPLASCRLSLQ